MDQATGLSTRRLRLRPFRPEDAACVAAMVSDLRVARFLTRIPWPYDLDAAQAFLRRIQNRHDILAVEAAGALVGCIELSDHLGYWIGLEHWGRGYASEAAEAMVARRFADTSGPIGSGHAEDNPASAAVLRKLGFRVTGSIEAPFPARRGSARLIKMTCARQDHAFALDPHVATDRLRLDPFRQDDAPAVSALGGEPEVSRMMSTIPHPFPPEAAGRWLRERQWRGRPGFCWAIRLRDGPLIGCVGLAPEGKDVAYWLGRPYWGKGYATEALGGFLAQMMWRFGLPGTMAEVFVDNPASARVLEKLGFRRLGMGRSRSLGRAEETSVEVFRLDARDLVP